MNEDEHKDSQTRREKLDKCVQGYRPFLAYAANVRANGEAAVATEEQKTLATKQNR